MNSPTVRPISVSPGRCCHFGEGEQDKPCLGAETFEHQYFIAKTNYIAVYKSHRAVCSFIEVVQNTQGTASPPGGRGGDSPRVGRHGAEGTPSQGCWCPGEGALGRGGGRRLPLRQGARSSHHVHRGQRCPRGHGAGGALCQPRSHPSSLFLTSPSPWSVVPVLEQGKAPQPPGNADGWEREKICWNDALKKQRWRQEQQKVPLWLVFPTMIKTSISAPARAISGREFGRWGWQGLHPMSRAEQCCCCCQLPPSSLKYQGGTGQGLGCRAGGGWISKMYRFTSSIYNQ